MSGVNTADFLVELGTEELPPKALLTLRDAFARGIVAGLAEAGLAHAEVLAFATPRRLAVQIVQLELAQAAQKIESRGPPLSLAFAEDGTPTKAAEAFAGKCNVMVSELTTVKTDKGEWLFFAGESAGLASKDLLPEIISRSLAGLPIPKRMRWGDSDVEFVRPVHWLIMLLGEDIVPATILGLEAGRDSFGHRFHAPDAITLQQPADYVKALREQGHVIVDFAERRAAIETAAHKAVTDTGGDVVLVPAVLDEVAALVEWPVPVAGHFDKSFLRLPREVLVSTLQDHQRYFPVQKDNKLLPVFVAISNLDSRDLDQVRRGNERVVLPRLADAAFFWNQDTARSLASRKEELKAVVYQQGLGSLHEKACRTARIAETIANQIGADRDEVLRAASLARTDLLTNMVGEFPELQGRMGFYYAKQDQEPENVAIALEEQYLPRHAGDRLPANPVGIALGLADRLDTLAGIFSLNKRPSGNKDPFGLRRQAMGVLRILIESDIDLNLPELLAQAVELQPGINQPENLAADLLSFCLERLRAWYLDGQAPGFAKGDVTVEMFEAVLSRAPASPLDFHQRLRAVHQFLGLESAISLAAANKRIANILKKVTALNEPSVNEALFNEAAEVELHAAVMKLLPGHRQDLANRDYQGALVRLAGLRPSVDGYFEQVLVMAEDDQLRLNRLAQLGQVRNLFLDVADISCIPAP